MIPIEPETDNFVKIKGAVMRPKIYEYNEDETIEDLIKFAQGFESSANRESITYVSKMAL